jgi:hypothetical protein
MNTWHSGDFVNILNALDRLNLRDDTNMVVGGGDVVAVIGI